jgi:hypothetical protein
MCFQGKGMQHVRGFGQDGHARGQSEWVGTLIIEGVSGLEGYSLRRVNGWGVEVSEHGLVTMRMIAMTMTNDNNDDDGDVNDNNNSNRKGQLSSRVDGRESLNKCTLSLIIVVCG